MIILAAVPQDVIGGATLLGGAFVMLRLLVGSQKAVERDAAHMEDRYKGRLAEQDQRIDSLEEKIRACEERDAHRVIENAQLRVALINANIPIPGEG